MDLSSTAYSTVKAVVQAALSGHCTLDEAIWELNNRLSDAADEVELGKISASISLLGKHVATSVSNHGVDCLSFIYAKITQVVTVSTDFMLSAPTAAGEKATIVRPTSEGQFYRSLHLWQYMLVILGMATMTSTLIFIKNTVDDVICRLKLPFDVAHEYFLIHLGAVAEGTPRVTLANVFTYGRQDTFMSEAKQRAEDFGACFRTRAGTAQPEGKHKKKGGDNVQVDVVVTKKYDENNGPYDKNAERCCFSYNFNQQHQRKHLDSTGVCKFKHACMQWVSDKGAGGMCGGPHRKKDCDYDKDKKLDKSL